MKVEFKNIINFEANFIKSGYIDSHSSLKNNYEKQKISFVKLNPYDENDVKALKDISNNWLYDTFSINIYNSAEHIKNHKNLDVNMFYKEAFYALTTQKDNFENLNYKNILGICNVRESEKKAAYLLHIQVHPENVYSHKPQYKGIGSTILTSLKSLYSKIELSSLSNSSVRNFYLKNGFTNIGKSSNKFIWKK